MGCGDIMYADLNGDGRVNTGSYTTDDPGDLRVIGNSTPRYNYGFTLDGSWKGFDLRLFFQGIGKRDLWSLVLTSGVLTEVCGNPMYLKNTWTIGLLRTRMHTMHARLGQDVTIRLKQVTCRMVPTFV